MGFLDVLHKTSVTDDPKYLVTRAFSDLVQEDGSVFKFQNIPESKLNKAKKDYATLSAHEMVLGLQDSSTLFGSYGVVCTTQAVYWKSYDGKSTGNFGYQEIDPTNVRAILPVGDDSERGLRIGPDTRIIMARIDAPRLRALATFIRKAALLARGTDVSLMPFLVSLSSSTPAHLTTRRPICGKCCMVIPAHLSK